MSIGITNGNAYGVYVIKATLTPVEVATIVAASQDFTVPGLLAGDMVVVNPPVEAGAVSLASARVKSANTLTITFVNPTAGALTPTAGIYKITVLRPEGAAPATSIGD